MQQADLSGAFSMTDLHLTRRGRWAVSAMFLANGFIMGAWAPQIPLLLPRQQKALRLLRLPRLQMALVSLTSLPWGRQIQGCLSECRQRWPCGTR
jgi:hypothetical protein